MCLLSTWFIFLGAQANIEEELYEELDGEIWYHVEKHDYIFF